MENVDSLIEDAKKRAKERAEKLNKYIDNTEKEWISLQEDKRDTQIRYASIDTVEKLSKQIKNLEKKYAELKVERRYLSYELEKEIYGLKTEELYRTGIESLPSTLEIIREAGMGVKQLTEPDWGFFQAISNHPEDTMFSWIVKTDSDLEFYQFYSQSKRSVIQKVKDRLKEMKMENVDVLLESNCPTDFDHNMEELPHELMDKVKEIYKDEERNHEKELVELKKKSIINLMMYKMVENPQKDRQQILKNYLL